MADTPTDAPQSPRPGHQLRVWVSDEWYAAIEETAKHWAMDVSDVCRMALRAFLKDRLG